MAHDGVRFHSPGPPQGSEGDLNRQKSGLNDVDFIHPIPGRIGIEIQLLLKRPIDKRSHRLRALLQGIPESGLPALELPAHPYPLRPLSRAHKYDLWGKIRLRFSRPHARDSLSPQKGLQAVSHIDPASRDQRRAMFVMGAVQTGGKADVVQGRGFFFVYRGKVGAS